MILSDIDIQKAIDDQRICFDPPLPTSRITGVSADLTLCNNFKVMRPHAAPYIDLGADKDTIHEMISKVMSESITIDENAPFPYNRFTLNPGEFALGVTVESVTIPHDLLGKLNGRSSLARLGLIVHITADRIDPGFSGQIVLEFYNVGSSALLLKPGMTICSLGFSEMLSPTQTPYNTRPDAKYKNQAGATSSLME